MYNEYGISWKQVYLLYGPPGTGKTSMVLAIASEFNKNIYKISVSGISGPALEGLVSAAKDGIVLLEDVDSLFKKREAKTAIDFSTLLNLLDGVNTQQGLVVFMSTNHLDELDKALVRDGRVDELIEFGYPTVSNVKQCLARLVPENQHEFDEFIEKMPENINFPVIQKHIFKMKYEDRTSILPPPDAF
jgi:chaperone BCS1